MSNTQNLKYLAVVAFVRMKEQGNEFKAQEYLDKYPEWRDWMLNYWKWKMTGVL